MKKPPAAPLAIRSFFGAAVFHSELAYVAMRSDASAVVGNSPSDLKKVLEWSHTAWLKTTRALMSFGGKASAA